VKKRWFWIGGGVLLLAAMIVVNLLRSEHATVKARTSKVEQRDVTARISAPGRVQAISSVDISAEVPGRVVELRVAEGDSVRAGDLLLRLDDSQYKSRVDQALAALRSAQAALTLAQARLDKLTRDQERLVALRAKDLASEEALDAAQTDVLVQQAEVEARREEVARFQAALDDARDNLEKTVYRAPVGGIVSRLNIEQGEIVITGTMNNPGTVILSLADLSAMEVEAEVDETDIVHVKTGQVAHITVDAIPDTTFPGSVTSVGNSGRRVGAGTVEDATNFEVKVRFLHPDPRLRPGMTADIEVETETHRNVLTVPLQALVARTRGKLEQEKRAAAREKEGKEAPSDTAEAPADTLSEDERREREREVLEGVYKLDGDEAVFVEVQAGIADETRIEVTGDLQEGDRVVSGPYRVLRDLKEGTRIEEETEKADATGS